MPTTRRQSRLSSAESIDEILSLRRGSEVKERVDSAQVDEGVEKADSGDIVPLVEEMVLKKGDEMKVEDEDVKVPLLADDVKTRTFSMEMTDAIDALHREEEEEVEGNVFA